MRNTKLKIFVLMIIFQLFSPYQAFADQIRIAVASNFYPTMKEIIKQFELDAIDSFLEAKIILIPGSSGKHYAQIINGAPFDLFFSADTLRPAQLEQKEVFNNSSRFTYALGKLVLWSPNNSFIDSEGQILYDNDFRFLAIANPKISPYGLAAKETLVSMNLWQDMNQKLVRGENIAQTFQFVSSRNSEIGFVSFSQIRNPNNNMKGSFWEVPQSLYGPIEQQAVLLRDSKLGRDFMKFIKTKKALDIISKYGYDLP